MTLWELRACVAGFIKANSSGDASTPLTTEEHDALVDKYRHLD